MKYDETHAPPAEFHYWANVEMPWVKALRTMGRAVLGFDLAPSDDFVRKFASSYYDADPLAEAFVEDVYFARSAGEGRAMLDQAIAHGVASVPNAPASLERLFEDVEHDPEWLDHELVAHGARVFRRYGTAMFRF